MIVAGQPQVTYTYDNANRLTQIAQGHPPRASGIFRAFRTVGGTHKPCSKNLIKTVALSS
jgi:hypothetical protein